MRSDFTAIIISLKLVLCEIVFFILNVVGILFHCYDKIVSDISRHVCDV